MSDNGASPDPGRLPPPTFPPGSAKRRVARPAPLMADLADDSGEGAIPADAIFSPDDAVTRSGTRVPDDAFFSPDQPVVRQAPPTKPEDFEAVMEGIGGEDETEGVVTGIGLSSHVRKAGEAHLEDPHVERLYVALKALTRGVRDRGEAGLRTTNEMSRFEATLRGYCVGYLAGLRETPDLGD